MSELRVDALSGDTVIVAPARESRPHQSEGNSSSEEPACPLCAGNEDMTPPSILELLAPDAEHWSVRVIPNRYPMIEAPGAHEVVVETPHHDRQIPDRPVPDVALMLQAYRVRLAALQASRAVRYVTLFRNQGDAAGASLLHPHSQVVALPYVPRAVSTKVRRWRRHQKRTGSCLLCEALRLEQEARERVVRLSDSYILYVPRGGVISGELVLAPTEHVTSFTAGSDETLEHLAGALIDATRRLRAAFDDPSFNLTLATWPGSGHADAALHWYIRILPRRQVFGGFELATGDFVSTLSAEKAAGTYRDAIPAR